MKCNNCGAEIYDGAPNCPNCGAPVMAPMGAYPGAGAPVSSFKSPIPTEFYKFISFAGAGLIFLGVVIPRLLYYKMSGSGEKESDSMGLFSSGAGVLKLWAIFLLIAAAAAVVIEIVPAVKDIVKNLPFYQFYAPGLGLLSLILIMTNKDVKAFRDMISLMKGMMSGLASAFGGGNVSVSGGWGISFWLILLGVIALIGRGVLGFLSKED